METLAVSHGSNVRRDTYRLGELSNAGKAWRNSNNTLRGEPFTGSRPPAQEWMSDAEYADLTRHVADGELDYVIRSWDTVIAYRAHGAWHLSSAKHSVTTTKHQGKLYVLRMARCGYSGPDAT